jgi:hypothetical protein
MSSKDFGVMEFVYLKATGEPVAPKVPAKHLENPVKSFFKPLRSRQRWNGFPFL